MEHKELKLLPNYFKKIGLLFFGLAIAFILLFTNHIIPLDNEVAKTITFDIIFIGLLILAISKEKLEDERTTKLRLIAFAFSFISAVGFVIVMPFVNILFGDNFLSEVSSNQLLLTMFILYFAAFSSGKKYN